MIHILMLLQTASPMDKVIPFHEPVGMLRTVVKQLATASGVKLDVSKATWDSGIYISSENLKLREIMDGLADATYCDWELQGSTWYLKPSQSKRIRARLAAEKPYLAELE